MKQTDITGNSAAVLAGGRSRRFGRDKALWFYKGTPLLEHILNQLEEIFPNILILSGSSGKFRDYPYPVIPDIYKDSGPLGGIHAALLTARSPYVFITACDMPNISLPLIRKMQEILAVEKPEAVVVSRQGRIEPLHAFYASRTAGKAEGFLKSGRFGLSAFADSLETVFLDGEDIQHLCQDDPFVNFNYPEDVR